MAGDGRRTARSERPRAAFRPVTLSLLAVVGVLAPEAVRAAAEQPLLLLGWTALLSASSLMYVVSVPRLEIETTLRTPLEIASVVVLPPPLAFASNVLALVSARELRPGVSPWKILFNHTQTGLAAYATAALLQGSGLGRVAATLVAVPVFDLLNFVACVVGTWLMGRGTFREAVRGAAMPFPHFATSWVLIALMAVLIVVLYTMASPWAVGLLAVPLWVGYNALRSAKTADERAEELALRVRELEVVHGLGTALLSARDERRVVALAARALRDICPEAPPNTVAVGVEGTPPAHVERRVLPGTEIAVWVPAGLDERRAAEVETICSATGISLQRLRVEDELRESQRAQADLAEGILAEGTAARSRVALNVHDDVLPHLAAAQMQADNVLHATELGRTEMAKDLAGRVLSGVSDGIAALREVLDDLQRQTIVPGDLLPVIRRVSDEYRVEHGLTVELDAERYLGGLSHAVEILLTETVTGLLTNVVRHARATRVRVRVATEGPKVTAEVSDDGVGFEPEQIAAGHHGLTLMRQRVAIVHGSFEIDTAPDRGTTVRVCVPSGAGLLLRQPEQPEPRQPHTPAVVREHPVRR